MGEAIDEVMLLAKFKCPAGVSVAQIVREVKPAQRCKGLSGRAFYNCLSRVMEEELTKRGCKRI
jgi:hypothetical protein